MSAESDLIVVDSSVVAKWLIPEDDTPVATALRERHRFAVPDVLFPEIANILWKHVGRGTITAKDVDDALVAIRYFKPRVIPSRSMFADACRLAVALNHPAYDCFYLLAAARLATVVVTADTRLLRKLRSGPAAEWAAVAVGLDAAAGL
jgi:predicted nucleic acid-binding protein